MFPLYRRICTQFARSCTAVVVAFCLDTGSFVKDSDIIFGIIYLLICIRCCVEGPSCFVIYSSAVVRNGDLFQAFQQCTAVFFCNGQPVVAAQADGFSSARITVCQCSCSVDFCNCSVSFESVFTVIKIEICDHGFFCCLKFCTHFHG